MNTCCLGLYIVPLNINRGHHRKTKGNKSSFAQRQSNQWFLMSNHWETVNSSDNLTSLKRRHCWVSGPLYLDMQAYLFQWFLRGGGSSAQWAGHPGKGLHIKKKKCLFLINSEVSPSITKIIFKKNKFVGFTVPEFKTYYKGIINKTVWYRHKEQ